MVVSPHSTPIRGQELISPTDRQTDTLLSPCAGARRHLPVQQALGKRSLPALSPLGCSPEHYNIRSRCERSYSRCYTASSKLSSPETQREGSLKPSPLGNLLAAARYKAAFKQMHSPKWAFQKHIKWPMKRKYLDLQGRLL